MHFSSKEARFAHERMMKAIDEAPIAPPCQTTDPEIFFPEGRGSTDSIIAKRLCNQCPVKDLCLEYALLDRVDEGVWGGTTYHERRNRKSWPICARVGCKIPATKYQKQLCSAHFKEFVNRVK